MGWSRVEFDRELEAIEAKVIELFGMVAEDLPAVTQAFLDGRGDMAAAVLGPLRVPSIGGRCPGVRAVRDAVHPTTRARPVLLHALPDGVEP